MSLKDKILIVVWSAIICGVIGLGHSNNLIFSPLRLDEARNGLIIGIVLGLFIVVFRDRS